MKHRLLVAGALLLAGPACAGAAERLKPEPTVVPADYLKRNHEARVVKWQHPDYPAEPGATWLNEPVVVAFVIDEQGRVSEAECESGAERFRAPALAAICAWTFEPAMDDGKPVPSARQVEFNFLPTGTPVKMDRDNFWPPYPLRVPDLVPPGGPAQPRPAVSAVPRRPAHLGRS